MIDQPTPPTMDKFDFCKNMVQAVFEANTSGGWDLQWHARGKNYKGPCQGLSVYKGDARDPEVWDAYDICTVMDLLLHLQKLSHKSFHIIEVFDYRDGTDEHEPHLSLIFEMA